MCTCWTCSLNWVMGASWEPKPLVACPDGVEQVMGFTINDLMHIIWLIMFHPIIRLGMIGNTIVTAYPITISTRRATITMRTTTKFTTCMTTVRTTTKTMASTITTRITKTFAAYNWKRDFKEWWSFLSRICS